MPTSPTTHSLDSGALEHLATSMAVPTYDRNGLRRSIVHIGVGGFHRAHLATYVDELCGLGDTDWSIVGAGVLPGDARMATVLGEQDHLYTLITRGAAAADVQVIGSIVDYLHATPDPEPLIERIADPDTQIVSLTVTEGGYPIDDATGDYRPDSSNAGPGSAFAAIAAGLERRRARDVGPVTVLSCDNILANGNATRAATVGEARTISAELAEWIDREVTFPNSMVDRITPATTDADRSWLAEHHGLDDGWPVVTEPFRQWVVEDRFAGERLPLERLDVIVTDDVEPYEMMKLRLLNAGHSCLAYLAALQGIETVDQALADPAIRGFLQAFLRSEARPVVPAVAGVDLDDYVDSLIVRFSNPNIGDQIARLCLDGSAKFPKFLMPTIATQLERGGPVRLSALALAGWCQYLRVGSDPESGVELSPDPALQQAVDCAVASADDPAAFLEFDLVFDPSLRSGPFTDAFVAALGSIRTLGVPSAIDAALS
ncbi:mannitol dehydrogenase family protein [Ilumatobacter sp.]|uniref:mannitol dehydrogenase family protein n=1 Tax=Ilumatobacter sp. TaxID=1967498 RepID=UPI003AF5E368